jgi:hypothetical protein
MSISVRTLAITGLLSLACESSTQPWKDFGPRQSRFIPDAATTVAYGSFSAFDQPANLVMTQPVHGVRAPIPADTFVFHQVTLTHECD